MLGVAASSPAGRGSERGPGRLEPPSSCGRRRPSPESLAAPHSCIVPDAASGSGAFPAPVTRLRQGWGFVFAPPPWFGGKGLETPKLSVLS